jgi:hypothetical protein
MDMIEILTDVAQAKQGLAVLNVSPARLKICATAISDLERTLEEILTVAWVPRSLHELHTAIPGDH